MPPKRSQKDLAAVLARKRVEMLLELPLAEVPNPIALMLGQYHHTNTKVPADPEGSPQGDETAAPSSNSSPAGGVSDADANAIVYHIATLLEKAELAAAEGKSLPFLSLVQLLSEGMGACQASEAACRQAFIDDRSTLFLALERIFKMVLVHRQLKPPTLQDIEAASCAPQQRLCSYLGEAADQLAVTELLGVVGAVCSIEELRDECGEMFMGPIRDALVQHAKIVREFAEPLYSFAALRAMGTIMIVLINGSKENKTRLPSWAFIGDVMGATSDAYFQIQCLEILFRNARPDPRVIDEWRHRCTHDRVKSVVLARLKGLLTTPTELLFQSMAELIEKFNLDAVPKREQTLVSFPAKSIMLGDEANLIEGVFRVYFTPNSMTILFGGPSADNLTVPYTSIRSIRIPHEGRFVFKLHFAPIKARDHVLVDVAGRESITIDVNSVAAKTFLGSPVQRWIMEALERRRLMGQTSGSSANRGGAGAGGNSKAVAAAIASTLATHSNLSSSAFKSGVMIPSARSTTTAIVNDAQQASGVNAEVDAVGGDGSFKKKGAKKGRSNQEASVPTNNRHHDDAAVAEDEEEPRHANPDDDNNYGGDEQLPSHQDVAEEEVGANDEHYDNEPLSASDGDTDPQLRDVVARISRGGSATPAAVTVPANGGGAAPPPPPAGTSRSLSFSMSPVNAATRTDSVILGGGRHDSTMWGADNTTTAKAKGNSSLFDAAGVAISPPNNKKGTAAKKRGREDATDANRADDDEATAANANTVVAANSNTNPSDTFILPSPEPGLKQFGSGSPMDDYTTRVAMKKKGATSNTDNAADEMTFSRAHRGTEVVDRADGSGASLGEMLDGKRSGGDLLRHEGSQPSKPSTGAKKNPFMAVAALMAPPSTPKLAIPNGRGGMGSGGEHEDDEALPKSRITKRAPSTSVFATGGSDGALGKKSAVIPLPEDDDDSPANTNAPMDNRRSDRLPPNNADDDEDDANTAAADNATAADPIETALAALTKLRAGEATNTATSNSNKKAIMSESAMALAAELSDMVLAKVHKLRAEATEIIAAHVSGIQTQVNTVRRENSDRMRSFNEMFREGIDAALQAEANITSDIEATLKGLNEDLVRIRTESSSNIKEQIAFMELEARQTVITSQESSRTQLLGIKAMVDGSVRTMTGAIEAAATSHTNPMEILKKFLSQQMEEQQMHQQQYTNASVGSSGYVPGQAVMML